MAVEINNTTVGITQISVVQTTAVDKEVNGNAIAEEKKTSVTIIGVLKEAMTMMITSIKTIITTSLKILEEKMTFMEKILIEGNLIEKITGTIAKKKEEIVVATIA